MGLMGLMGSGLTFQGLMAGAYGVRPYISHSAEGAE